MMIIKPTTTSNYKCCMCGDPGLSNQLFRCKVCRFRSQHRYCSNLYPKAESYTVCNWCIIQKNDDNHTTTLTSNNSSTNSSSSPAEKRSNNNTPKSNLGGPGPKNLKPISPIKKEIVGVEPAQSPSTRKRISAVNQGPPSLLVAPPDEKLRRTKSFHNYSSNSGRVGGPATGPVVIKHVFKNKVRRYKLLDEVSG